MKKLVTLDQAVDLLNKAHQIDPEVCGRDAYSKQTLYNAIYKKKLARFGPKHILQIDVDELLLKYGPKKVS